MFGDDFMDSEVVKPKSIKFLMATSIGFLALNEID